MANFLLTYILCFILTSIAYANDYNIRFLNLNSENGFPRKNCLAIEQDSVGYLWYASYNGVMRYDGYEIKEYTNNPYDSTSINSNIVYDIHQDAGGDIWFAGDGFSRYNRINDSFENYKVKEKIDLFITSVDSDKNGTLWVGTVQGLFTFDKNTGKFSETNIRHYITDFKISYPHLYFLNKGHYAGIYNIAEDKIEKLLTPETYNVIDRKDKILYCITIDNNKTVWFGGENNLYKYKNDTLEKIEISKEKNISIFTIFIDKNQFAWLGTLNSGLILYDLKQKQAKYFRKEEDKNNAISSNTISTIFKDKANTMWLGTHNGGVNFCNLNDISVAHYKTNKTANKVLKSDFVSCFIHDANGNIIIGQDGGGISIVDTNMNLLRYFDTSNGLITNAVTDLDKDEHGNIYVSQWQGGVMVLDKNYNIIKPNILINDTLENCNIKAIFYDSKKRLWIFNPNTNLVIYDTERNVFYDEHKPGYFDTTLFYYKPINDAIEDTMGNIWFVSDNTLIKYKPNNTARVYFQNISDTMAIKSNKILSIFKDSKNDVWISTLNGLSRYNKEYDGFNHYKTLSNKVGLIYAMTEDEHDNLWFSSSNGLGKLNLNNSQFNLYDKSFNISGNSFRERAVFKSQSGKILFGSNNGFIIFHPEAIQANKNVPKIIFSEFKVFNKTVTLKNAPDILNKSIELTDTIIVKQAQSVLTFKFTALSFISPEKNHYAYFLKGFDQDWNYGKNLRNVTYTNLDPGTYQLFVKASNNEGVWNNKAKCITIIVTPPWWKTWYFKLFLILVILGVVVLLFYIKYQRVKNINLLLEKEVALRTRELRAKNKTLRNQKSEIESQNKKIRERNVELFEKKEEIESQQDELAEKNDQLKELNKTKDKFLSIISHDLKNPMGALICFAELLSESFDHYSNEKKKEFIGIILSSSRNLLALLENLLEWSRNQTGKIKFTPKPLNLNGIINNSIYLFKGQAKQKQINLVFENTEPYNVYADSNMIDTVIRNLISNALKFTHPDGMVKIEVQKNTNQYIQIKVIDTGVGMTNDQLKDLFKLDKTVSTNGTKDEVGTGLGLILCKDFIERHCGSIWAESAIDKGSCFNIKLPIDYRKHASV